MEALERRLILSAVGKPEAVFGVFSENV